MGTVALPEMKRYKYDDGLATGSCAAGGCLGGFIPPSVGLVIFCILTRMSIGTQFITAFVPGVVNAILFMMVIGLICKRHPDYGPPGPKTSLMNKVKALKNTWAVLMVFVLVIGGMYGGVFTPTEAAAVGAFFVLLYALARRKVTWKNFIGSLLDTGRVTAMVLLILIGTAIFGFFLTLTDIPMALASWVSGLDVSRYIIWAGLVFVYLIMGCLMDGLAIMMLTIPIVFPMIVELGFHPVWFGCAKTIILETALMTPPVGMNVFIIKGVAKDVNIYTIFRGTYPFVLVCLFYVALVTAFPDIIMFVPRSLGLV